MPTPTTPRPSLLARIKAARVRARTLCLKHERIALRADDWPSTHSAQDLADGFFARDMRLGRVERMISQDYRDQADALQVRKPDN